MSKISSIYSGRAPLRPDIDRDLERELIARILGMNTDEKDLDKAIRKFWAEMSIAVEQSGIVLNITTDENGYPENPSDWLRYQFALAHKEVADTEQEMARHPNKHYYIRDPEIERQKTNANVKARKKAYTEFINIGEDEDKMNMVLRALGTLNPTEMVQEEKENTLEKYAKNSPEKFYNVATDKNLAVRAEILKMIDKGVLNQTNSGIYFNDDQIGSTMDEAIKFFKSKQNSETLLTLRDKLAEAK